MKKIALLLVLLCFVTPQSAFSAETKRTYDQDLGLVKKQISAKDYLRAEQALVKMLRRYPDNRELLSMLGSVLFWEGKFEESLKVYDGLLRLPRTKEFAKDRKRVANALALRNAGRLLEQGDTAGAEKILLPMTVEKNTLYDAGILLAPAYFRDRRYESAARLLDVLIAQYPKDRDIVSMRASVHLALGEYDEAIGLNEALLRDGHKDAGLAIEAIKKQKRLAEAGRMYKEGRDSEALEVFRKLFDDDIERCDTGYMTGVLMLRSGDTDGAIRLIESMRPECDGNKDTLLLLASAYYRAGLLSESVSVYQQAGQGLQSDDLRRAQKALELARIDQLLKDGRNDEARRALIGMLSAEPASYDAGFRLGMSYFAGRDFENAIDIFGRMRTHYPEDTDFAALHVEALIMDGQKREALGELNALPQKTQSYIRENREDLYYRATGNYLKLYSGAWDIYYGNLAITEERNMTIESGIRLSPVTAVIRASRISKYELTDTQAAVDLYAGLGERKPLWGYISLSSCPDAEFLPEYTFGAEIYKNHGPFEYSLGYTMMVYANSDVSILKPGLSYYAPKWISLTEKLYYIPEQGSYSLDTTLNFEPGHRFRSSAGFAFGSTSERSIALGDMQKIDTYSWRIGAEYRFSRILGVGVEISEEYRDYAIKRRGGAIYTRLWW